VIRKVWSVSEMVEPIEDGRPIGESTRSDARDILQIYFREISRFPVLAREEERALAQDMARGRVGARERLIVSNLRLVVRIAQEYADAGLPLTDLIQEGNIGLIEAVDRFDAERGYRLSTYASWWIRRAMLKAITDYSRLIRIPDYLFRAVRRFEQMRQLSETTEIEDEEITQALGVSVDRLRQIEHQVREIVSLDQALTNESDETVEDLIADETGLSPEKEALRILFHDKLEAMLDHLPSRQAFAVRLFYGLEDGCPYTFAEVARVMEISRERARQLVQQGLNRLSEQWGERALDFYRGLLRE
jgi:RNA polymerase primary sigma factor